MKNDTFHILWYVNLHLYIDLMQCEINTNTNTENHPAINMFINRNDM
jgi:hypothetical protein